MTTFRICIYEPNVDPGGYTADFDVEANTEHEARMLALTLAQERWPDNKGLAVYSVTSWRPA